VAGTQSAKTAQGGNQKDSSEAGQKHSIPRNNGPRLSEQDIQKLIIAWLRTIGIFCWRNNTTGVYDPRAGAFRTLSGIGALTGVSDILGITHQGRFLAIEIKCRTGKVSKDQQDFMDQINARGGLAFVARSLDDAKEMLCKSIA
jgi:hypothetical protein